MDEIEFKLNSNNPILITHAVSRILDMAKKKIATNQDKSKIPELNSLFCKCKSENSAVSTVSCQAVVTLVESGLLEAGTTLSKLIAILGEAKNYSAITSAICSLLILDLNSQNSDFTAHYSIQAPQHPLITVLTQKIDAWRDVISEMQAMLHHSSEDGLRQRVDLLRPVFIYILANPDLNLPESCRHEAWHLLIKTRGSQELQLEVLQWLKAQDAQSCINTMNLALQLAEVATTQKNRDLCSALVPYITALALELLKHSSDPRPGLNIVENLLEFANHFVGDASLLILSEMLLITPSIYLQDIFKVAKCIIAKLNCRTIVVYSLAASILPWMAYANVLSNHALDIGRELINTITLSFEESWEPREIEENNFFNLLQHAETNFQFYTNIADCVAALNDQNLVSWLDKLSELPVGILCSWKIILGGIFLCKSWHVITTKVGHLLVMITRHKTNFCSHVLSLLLHRLANVRDPDEAKELLFMMPELARSKENVPIIVQTLETMLNAGAPLKYVAINLYLKTWMAEPRCHRHLSGALIKMCKEDCTMRGNTTCAKAMKFICENRPEHGAELVPLLSQILNRCGDMSGSSASALALKGISALCVAGIADVCSTWKVLAPKMNREDRPIVLRSICEFFADIPENTTYVEDEFDALLDAVSTRLWQLTCFKTVKNLSVIEAAFKALSAFSVNQIKFSTLPATVKSQVKLPAQLEAADDQKPEDVLTYIPGECWLHLIETVYDPCRMFAGDLVIKFITDELYSFRSGIYMWPMGEPINFKYLPAKSPARAIGEFIRRYPLNSPPKMQKILLECLRIFAHKYPKALPPIKWSLLLPVIESSNQAWIYGISLACHQAAISPSAKEFLSKYMKEKTEQFVENCPGEFEKSWQLCRHLADICRGVLANILAPFLDIFVNYIVEKALMDVDNFVEMFEEFMKQFPKAMNDDLVHHDTKSLLTNVLEKIFIKIDVNHRIFSHLVKAMIGIPTEHIERITLPSVWNEITVEMMQKAIIVRAALVLKRDNEIPLSWMNEIIKVSSSIPGVHRCLMVNMKNIQSQLRQDKSNVFWTWDLMCKIQATIVDSNDSIEFLCDIFFITVIIFAGSDRFLIDDETILTSFNTRAKLFPNAIHRLCLMPHWRDTTLQIMDWLHIMRTSCLPVAYKTVFHNALVSLKKERYLNDHWIKYFSTKIPITW